MDVAATLLLWLAMLLGFIVLVATTDRLRFRSFLAKRGSTYVGAKRQRPIHWLSRGWPNIRRYSVRWTKTGRDESGILLVSFMTAVEREVQPDEQGPEGVAERRRRGDLTQRRNPIEQDNAHFSESRGGGRVAAWGWLLLLIAVVASAGWTPTRETLWATRRGPGVMSAAGVFAFVGLFLPVRYDITSMGITIRRSVLPARTVTWTNILAAGARISYLRAPGARAQPHPEGTEFYKGVQITFLTLTGKKTAIRSRDPQALFRYLDATMPGRIVRKGKGWPR